MRHLILVGLLPILFVLNLSVFQREALRSSGELVLLELAPADPRSLMQGDFMRLRYTAAQKANIAWQTLQKAETGEGLPGSTSHQMVLKLGEGALARFDRFFKDGEKLAENERLISYSFNPDGGTRTIELQPQSFFFQEGQAKPYSAARYGMMRLSTDGDHILVGLADETGKQIRPNQ